MRGGIRNFFKYLKVFWSDEPSSLVIKNCAKTHKFLLGTNITSSIIQAFTEGATLGVVFFAVRLVIPANRSQTKIDIGWMQNWEIVRVATSNLSPLHVFLILIAIAVLLQIVNSLAKYLVEISTGIFSAKSRSLVLKKIHAHVLQLSYASASNYSLGELAEYSVSGPEAVKIQIEYTSMLITGTILSLTYAAVLVRLSVSLLIGIAFLAIIVVGIQRSLIPFIARKSEDVSSSLVEVNSAITQDFQSLRLLHSNGLLEYSVKQIDSKVTKLEEQLVVRSRTLSILSPIMNLIPILAVAVLSLIIIVVNGTKSLIFLPTIVTFILALQRFNAHVTGLAGVTNVLADNYGRLSRLNEFLKQPIKVIQQNKRLFAYTSFENIFLSNISLKYPGAFSYALDSITLSISKGTTTAIVGPSGSGKTSLTDILLGLYSPSKGIVYIDGIDLNSLDIDSWRKCLGVVNQDLILLNLSIRDNISYGLGPTVDAEIVKASKKAHAHEFIKSLPRGYDTIVGERGYILSGGQKQRICLARALLRYPTILLLDEATSALDSQSERLIQDSIAFNADCPTKIIVAHRLSTIKRADHIIVLDKGRLVEQGTHNQLLLRGELYANLWKIQSES